MYIFITVSIFILCSDVIIIIIYTYIYIYMYANSFIEHYRTLYFQDLTLNLSKIHFGSG